ncbi:uncharacterized protein LOC108671734 [Hyalella azteca]|uniref:Uncharacterized protein LOC108671734 n=1 Tax=Hyalella azteca TaxID=294128 RepID=A0A8B7NMA6_HYAAZ|nr:uncharacterized protein LOC108671734 [Hyalella azteca]
MKPRWKQYLSLTAMLLVSVTMGQPARSSDAANAGSALDKNSKYEAAAGLKETKTTAGIPKEKVKCHARNLLQCGKAALEKLSKSKDSDKKMRCLIREDFLTCMSAEREKTCQAAQEAADAKPYREPPEVTSLRNDLRRNFKNCVLSYSKLDGSLGL